MVPSALRSNGMPKCSSSYTTWGAMRHMYSMASWSPSQSEPLMVSYMCQSQLSSAMLPSEAPMPPCAATVCERVGNTLESTATFRPARASCSEARMPEPPAPTMTTSNFRLGSLEVAVMFFSGLLCRLRSGQRWLEGLKAPEDLDGPARAGSQPDDGGHLQGQAQPDRLDVVHPDV